jgi:MoaA/NifB/PqqE/SkfB family radical SAM enzyme
MNLSILYRGPLSSCNYGCVYCPFAKHQETRQEHDTDRCALERFVEWVAGRTADQLGILFTPWGEALIRKRYQQALIRLTNLPNVTKAAIQTNLSCRLAWVDECDKGKLALWVTYHPTETTLPKFLDQCAELVQRGVRFSAGVVGLKEHGTDIEILRRELPQNVYLWINAYKRDPNYYTEADIRRLEAIDPLFRINTNYHPSQGRACRAGDTIISVDGEGNIRRCHFIKTVVGNIYAPGFEAVLQRTPCSNQTCGCHIGYVHMDDLKLYEVFGDGVLERIPAERLW